jgi:hypothetical protein
MNVRGSREEVDGLRQLRNINSNVPFAIVAKKPPLMWSFISTIMRAYKPDGFV